MTTINAWLDRFVYRGDKLNADTHRKGRFFVISMALFTLLNLAYVPYYLADSVETVPWVKELFYVSLACLILIFIVYPRYGYRNLLFALFCIPSALSSFIAVYYTTGALYSSDLGLSLVMVLFIFLVTNKAIGIISSVIHILIYIGFYYAEIHGYRDFRADANALDADYYLTITIVCFVFGTLMIWLHEIGKDRYLAELKKSKLEIEHQQAEIISSITYAKKIQQAKLPPKDMIHASLPESFVIFKPKDIVSGDFYFFHEKNDLVFLAAADCTGHGVPGAFMSILCSEKLEDALLKSSDVSEILQLVNKSIKASLKQSDQFESTKDGMDIALCCIDKRNQQVKFAGANRPFWLLRKGQTQVEEIKGTKKAIAGFTEDHQAFETHTLQLERGDTFYVSTDGYADTFGGDHNKKLSTKRLKELLVSMQGKALREQERLLDEFVETWKGKTEQVDDILLMGVRL